LRCASYAAAGQYININGQEVCGVGYQPICHGVYIKEDSRTHRGKAVNKSVDIGNSESIVIGTKAAIEGGECGMDKLREMAAITDRPVFLEHRFLGIECVGGATTFGD
jgi:hypothetical protein